MPAGKGYGQRPIVDLMRYAFKSYTWGSVPCICPLICCVYWCGTLNRKRRLKMIYHYDPTDLFLFPVHRIFTTLQVIWFFSFMTKVCCLRLIITMTGRTTCVLFTLEIDVKAALVRGMDLKVRVKMLSMELHEHVQMEGHLQWVGANWEYHILNPWRADWQDW